MLFQEDVISVLREAVYTTLLVSAPMTLIALAIGLIVSILQATTQIHEATLAFVPKIIGVFVALIIFAGFMMGLLEGFTTRMFQYMGDLLQ